MHRTLCNNCIFLDKQNNSCHANKLCLKDNDKIYTPGYCRLFKTNKWSEKLDLTKTELLQVAKNECKFLYDLVILFKQYNTLSDLQKTMLTFHNDGVLQNTIIVCNKINDKTKIKELIQFAKKEQMCKIIFTIEDMSDSLLLYQAKNEIKSKYFICLCANGHLIGRTHFSSCMSQSMITYFIQKQLSNYNDSAMLWLFRQKIKNSLIINKRNVFGIYLTDIYKRLATPESDVKKLIFEMQNQSEIMLVDIIEGVRITEIEN